MTQTITWSPLSTAPTDGTHFMIYWLGDWHPQCKIKNGKLFEWTIITKFYESYMDWEMIEDRYWNNIVWAPQPTDPTEK